jgi:tRNA nucleotidyltransferase/poly(A) polymerase
MKVHAPEIKVVSRERIVAELHGIWLSSRPGKGLSLLRETGLLAGTLPFLELVPADDLNLLEDRLARLPELFLPDESRLVVAWVLHLELSNEAMAAGWSHRLVQEFKLSRAKAREISNVLGTQRLLLDPEATRLGRCRQRMLAEDWPSCFGFLRAREGEGSALVSWWRRAEKEMLAMPPRLEARLSGADLQGLGLTPGPRFKELLEAVELEVLEGRLETRDEARAWLEARLNT